MLHLSASYNFVFKKHDEVWCKEEGLVHVLSDPHTDCVKTILSKLSSSVEVKWHCDPSSFTYIKKKRHELRYVRKDLFMLFQTPTLTTTPPMSGSYWNSAQRPPPDGTLMAATTMANIFTTTHTPSQEKLRYSKQLLLKLLLSFGLHSSSCRPGLLCGGPWVR